MKLPRLLRKLCFIFVASTRCSRLTYGYQILGGLNVSNKDERKDQPHRHVEILRHLGGRRLELDLQDREENGDVSMQNVVWDAGPVLADYITNPAVVKELGLQGSTVVELGSGVGLCSIVSDLVGAVHVVATDASTTSLRLIRQNVQRYQLDFEEEQERGNKRIDVFPILWGDLDTIHAVLPTRPDLILASDVVYRGSNRESLRSTIDALCPDEAQPSTSQQQKAQTVLIAHQWRENPSDDEVFFGSFRDLGFQVTNVDSSFFPKEYQMRGFDGRHPVSIFRMSRC